MQVIKTPTGKEIRSRNLGELKEMELEYLLIGAETRIHESNNFWNLNVYDPNPEKMRFNP